MALSEAQRKALAGIANAMVSPGKGILAADECVQTMNNRFAKVGIDNTEENRRALREVLFTTDKKVAESISGVILFHETVYQKTEKGIPFMQLLKEKGILPGITLDKGLVPLAGTCGETTTQGLDNLAERVEHFVKEGCKFAKWRCALRISTNEQVPSELAIQENANTLARYASICQAGGLVPIVEPDISMDGTHTLEESFGVCKRVLSATYKALVDHHVYLEGTVLKTNMVLPGFKCPKDYTVDQIAVATVQVLQETVPVAVPGVGFLSGGLSEDTATANLNAINKVQAKKPWSLTFCYGRALQGSLLAVWQGKKENTISAQEKFLLRAKCNGLASLGKYTKD